jgi:acyl-CoA hydrolase
MVTATFRSSMEIAVAVWGEDTLSGARWPTVECRTTFVAMGSDGRPVSVGPLLLETDQDRAAQAAAEQRRAARLAKR